MRQGHLLRIIGTLHYSHLNYMCGFVYLNNSQRIKGFSFFKVFLSAVERKNPVIIFCTLVGANEYSTMRFFVLRQVHITFSNECFP